MLLDWNKIPAKTFGKQENKATLDMKISCGGCGRGEGGKIGGVAMGLISLKVVSLQFCAHHKMFSDYEPTDTFFSKKQVYHNEFWQFL